MTYLPMELDLYGSLEHVKRLSDECRPDVERFIADWTDGRSAPSP